MTNECPGQHLGGPLPRIRIPVPSGRRVMIPVTSVNGVLPDADGNVSMSPYEPLWRVGISLTQAQREAYASVPGASDGGYALSVSGMTLYVGSHAAATLEAAGVDAVFVSGDYELGLSPGDYVATLGYRFASADGPAVVQPAGRYATLDGSGTVPRAQLPANIRDLPGLVTDLNDRIGDCVRRDDSAGDFSLVIYGYFVDEGDGGHFYLNRDKSPTADGRVYASHPWRLENYVDGNGVAKTRPRQYDRIRGVRYVDMASNRTYEWVGPDAGVNAAGSTAYRYQSVADKVDVSTLFDSGSSVVKSSALPSFVLASTLFDNPATAPTIKSSLLPSYVDDVLEYANLAGFPGQGESGKIYVARDTGRTYRWPENGSAYVEIAASPVSSVNGRTGAVVLTAADLGALTSHQDISGKADKSTTYTKTEVDAIVTGYKTKQTAVSDPTASGNAVSFIDSISQNANGEMTATKKSIPNAAASTGGAGGSAGLMTAVDKEKLNGLGTAANKNVPASGNAEATEVVLGNDSRLSDPRAPTVHKSSHAIGGSDALTPADIGAASAADLTTLVSTVSGHTTALAGKAAAADLRYAIAAPLPDANDRVELVDRAVNRFTGTSQYSPWTWNDEGDYGDPVWDDTNSYWLMPAALAAAYADSASPPRGPITLIFSSYAVSSTATEAAYVGFSYDGSLGMTITSLTGNIDGSYTMGLAASNGWACSVTYSESTGGWMAPAYSDGVWTVHAPDLGATPPSFGTIFCEVTGEATVIATRSLRTLGTFVPPAAAPGHMRDFLVRLDLTGVSGTAPSIGWSPTDAGSAAVSYETEDGAFIDPEAGKVNLLSFTETAPGVFAVAHKTVEAVPNEEEAA